VTSALPGLLPRTNARLDGHDLARRAVVDGTAYGINAPPLTGT
jgi:hypothetical protein